MASAVLQSFRLSNRMWKSIVRLQIRRRPTKNMPKCYWGDIHVSRHQSSKLLRVCFVKPSLDFCISDSSKIMNTLIQATRNDNGSSCAVRVYRKTWSFQVSFANTGSSLSSSSMDLGRTFWTIDGKENGRILWWKEPQEPKNVCTALSAYNLPWCTRTWLRRNLLVRQRLFFC